MRDKLFVNEMESVHMALIGAESFYSLKESDFSGIQVPPPRNFYYLHKKQTLQIIGVHLKVSVEAGRPS